jgi:hypothetical protein
MCLHDIKFSVDENGIGRGFKVYEYIHGRFFGAIATSNETMEMLNGKWRKSNSFVYKFSPYKEYRTGFHMFLSLKDAILWWKDSERVFFEVEYKNVLAFGPQAISSPNDVCCDVVVADEMRFVKQVLDEDLLEYGVSNAFYYNVGVV